MIDAEITGGLEHPDIVPVYGADFRNDLTCARLGFGWLLTQMRKSSEAEADYGAALALVQKRTAENTGFIYFGSSVAAIRYYLGALLLEMGKPSEAEAQYGAALAHQQKLADAKSALRDFRGNLASAATATLAIC